jgi:riboflavin kinase/FMN adenylyltransferase
MGKQLGRTIGFPTANIALDDTSTLPHGIYVSLVRVNGGPRRGSVSYIGRRPTVQGTSLLLETHIFDFDQAIYGAFLTVELLEQLRGDAFFDSLETLTAQIDRDCAQARSRLATLLAPATGNRIRPTRERFGGYSELVA